MPDCKMCNSRFPNWIELQGKRRNLSSRKYCLACSPFGLHNTKQLNVSRSIDSLSEGEFRTVVESSISVAEVLRKMGKPAKTHYYKKFRNWISRFEIDISHFKGKSSGRGGRKIPLDKILVKNSTYLDTRRLKMRLISAGILEHVCATCGIDEWNSKPISLHLDHINGDPIDHRLENLRILCPNCHSQTPTFSRGHKRRKQHGA